ncbi:AMIN-like domain-containing (lipo)protein [Arthrobacter sp. CAN_A2]|uniref:AMIN-like domain-containing (lipo)protein n=1 Tax=Arthrobacter sp. CAN_A2 TaxID=2787718 RepID=UPI0018F05911
MTGKLSATLAALALTAGLGLAGGPPASAAYCDITWGSTAKTASTTLRPAPITDVRAGRHACFDRMVVDLRRRTAGYTVQYVDDFTGIASGLSIPLRGGARLSVTVNAPAYNQAGRPTYRPADTNELVNVAGYTTFRQIAYGGSFEGLTSFGLGVRARLPMRAFVVPGPGAGSRVVIDVAHRW